MNPDRKQIEAAVRKGIEVYRRQASVIISVDDVMTDVMFEVDKLYDPPMYLVTQRREQAGPPTKGGTIWEVQCSCGFRFDVNTTQTGTAVCPRCTRDKPLSQLVPPPM